LAAEIEANVVERSIRSIALGRKNHLLFAGSNRGDIGPSLPRSSIRSAASTGSCFCLTKRPPNAQNQGVGYGSAIGL
jgi:hypothetical protein